MFLVARILMGGMEIFSVDFSGAFSCGFSTGFSCGFSAVFSTGFSGVFSTGFSADFSADFSAGFSGVFSTTFSTARSGGGTALISGFSTFSPCFLVWAATTESASRARLSSFKVSSSKERESSGSRARLLSTLSVDLESGLTVKSSYESRINNWKRTTSKIQFFQRKNWIFEVVLFQLHLIQSQIRLLWEIESRIISMSLITELEKLDFRSGSFFSCWRTILGGLTGALFTFCSGDTAAGSSFRTTTGDCSAFACSALVFGSSCFAAGFSDSGNNIFVRIHQDVQIQQQIHWSWSQRLHSHVPYPPTIQN